MRVIVEALLTELGLLLAVATVVLAAVRKAVSHLKGHRPDAFAYRIALTRQLFLLSSSRFIPRVAYERQITEEANSFRATPGRPRNALRTGIRLLLFFFKFTWLDVVVDSIPVDAECKEDAEPDAPKQGPALGPQKLEDETRAAFVIASGLFLVALSWLGPVKPMTGQVAVAHLLLAVPLVGFGVSAICDLSHRDVRRLLPESWATPSSRWVRRFQLIFFARFAWYAMAVAAAAYLVAIDVEMAPFKAGVVAMALGYGLALAARMGGLQVYQWLPLRMAADLLLAIAGLLILVAELRFINAGIRNGLSHVYVAGSIQIGIAAWLLLVRSEKRLRNDVVRTWRAVKRLVQDDED